MNYADPFGLQETTPLSRALRRITLDENQQLNWPAGYLGPDYIASINLVAPSATGLTLSLPNALGASEGTGFLIVNIGSSTFSLLDYDGTVVTTLDAGQAKYLFCEGATDTAGVWHSIIFGEGVSEADASALAGFGMSVTDGKLSVGLSVSTTASDITIGKQHRGRVLVNNGGSVIVNLPQFTELGNDFFVCLHNGGSGTMSINPSTGNKVDDYDTFSLAPNESIILCCSGTAKWYTLGYGRSTQFQFTKLVKDVTVGGTITLTSAETSNKLLQFTGAPASNVTVIVPSVVGIYYVQNTYSGPNTLTLKTQSGSGLSLNASDRAIVYCDGVNVVSAQSVAVGVNLSVVDGSLNTPSIGFSSDPNTGFYKADFDTVGISSNGSEAARFNITKSAVSGQFGIGTVDPASMLHVKSNIPEAVRLEAQNGFISFYDGSTRNATIASATKQLNFSVEGTNSLIGMSVNGVKQAEISSAGLKIFSNITDGFGNQFAKLSANNFTGIQFMPVQRGKVSSAPAAVSGVVTLDVSKASTYSLVVTGPVRLDFIGQPPAGQEQTIYVKLTNGGTNVTYGTMCQFPDAGLRPTLSATGKDVLAVWYDPETSAFVVGRAFKDYRA